MDVNVVSTVSAGGTSNSNITQFGGSNIATGTGVSGAGVPRVTVSSDSSIIVTQATGTNLHAVLDAGSAVIGHVISDAGSVVNATLQAGAAVIGSVTQSGTWTVQPGNTANTTPWLATIAQGGNSALVSAAGALKVNPVAPTSGITLTSASPTVCTNVQAVAGRGVEIINSGPSVTVFLQIYNDAAATCAAGTLLWGDGTSLTLGYGQIVKIDFPVSGVAYKLSGALTTNLSITGL